MGRGVIFDDRGTLKLLEDLVLVKEGVLVMVERGVVVRGVVLDHLSFPDQLLQVVVRVLHLL